MLSKSTMTALTCAVAVATAFTLRAEELPLEERHLLSQDRLGKLPEGIISSTLRISPDGKKIAGVCSRGNDKQVVFINGEESPEYESVVLDSIHFSPDSKRVAYGAKRDGKAFAMVDGIEYPAFDSCGAGFPIFNADGSRFMFAASRDGEACVVVNGKAGESYEAIMKGGPVFSPDGTRFLYVAKDGDWGRVVVDGVAGPKYRNVDAPMFSADGKHVTYVAMTPTKSILVVDGREAVITENFIRGSLAFDSPTRLHILALESHTVTRVQVDLLEAVKPQPPAP